MCLNVSLWTGQTRERLLGCVIECVTVDRTDTGEVARLWCLNVSLWTGQTREQFAGHLHAAPAPPPPHTHTHPGFGGLGAQQLEVYLFY